MQTAAPYPTSPTRPHTIDENIESISSSISWGAIFGGAFAAAGISMLLVTLGTGMGLAAAGPSTGGATTFTVTMAIWMIIVQWLSSGMGGYMAGRLRTKWTGSHTPEIFFRDTAHGFLSWAVAAVLGATLLAAAAGSAAHSSAQMAAASVISQSIDESRGEDGGSAAGWTNDPLAYYVDSLFRSNTPNAEPVNNTVRAETLQIIGRTVEQGGVKDAVMPPADKAYLARRISERTGISPPEAEARIDDTLKQIRDGLNEARKATSALSFFTFFSLLIGAFIACVAAALGGRHRDESELLPRTR
jgi:hypothetical protein